MPPSTVADTYDPMTTVSLESGMVFARYAARQVVKAGRKIPWRKRAPIKIQRSWVTAHMMPFKATRTPPVRIIGFIGNLSAKMPKGKLDRAMPRMTADTVKETVTISAANSACSTGNTGWVM